MALHSEFHMPGAFHSDGVHPGVFRPPHTASTPGARPPSSGYFAPRAMPTHDDLSSPKRKRRVQETSPHIRDTRADNDALVGHFDARFMEKASDRRYVLGGELSTPYSAQPTEEHEPLRESMFSDSDFRRMLGTKRPRDDVDQVSDQPMFSVPPLAQQPPTPTATQGWGTLAVTALGGVMGSIWRFCRAGSFNGFHAGGGRGYDLRPSVEDVSMLRDGESGEFHYQHPIPGHYPQHQADWSEKPSEEGGFFDSRASTPSRPSAKRRQTGTTDGLNKNWVMVDGPVATTPKRPGMSSRRATGTHQPSPRNRNQAPAVTTGRRISTPAARRSAARPSLASTPHIGSEHHSPTSASFASQRSPSPTKADEPASPFHTPKGQYSSRRHRPSASFTAGSPHRRTGSGASAAAANRASSQNDALDNSPRLDPEARKLAARRKRQDAHADARVTGLNQTVEDMIRQCQEALATNIEVEDDGLWEDDR